MAFTTEDVVVLTVPNQPGALTKGLARLAKAGVNIDYIYGTCSDCCDSRHCNMVISAPDLKAVEKAWGE